MPARPPRRPNAPRLISYKARKACAALAALTALAMTLAPARAGHYADPVYSGGTITCSTEDGTVYSVPAEPQWGGYGNQAQGAPAAVSGTFTATFTWLPDPGQTLQTDPPPAQVLVTRRCQADWYDGGAPAAAALASCDDGLGDAPTVYGPSYYTDDFYGDGDVERFYDAGGQSGAGADGWLVPHYSVVAGGPTVAVSCSPSLINAGGGPPDQEASMMVDVYYLASVDPITIDLSAASAPVAQSTSW